VCVRATESGVTAAMRMFFFFGVCYIILQVAAGLSVSSVLSQRLLRRKSRNGAQTVSYAGYREALTKALRTVEPRPINKATFLSEVGATPLGQDMLILLYSPTCPDCQWFINKVWWKAAAALQTDANLLVWTMADPSFAAPKPFEHWHNPALFFAPGNARLSPVQFPEKQLGSYLNGLPNVSQEQQDANFLNDLLRFVKQHEGAPNSLPAPPSPESEEAQQDLEKLAAKEWKMLEKRWADETKYGDPNAKPAPVSAAPAKKQQALLGAAKEEQEEAAAKAYAEEYVNEYVKTHPSYDRKFLLDYALKFYKKYEVTGR